MYVVYFVVCLSLIFSLYVFFFKQKTAYEMRISDWSSDVCSSDLLVVTDTWVSMGQDHAHNKIAAMASYRVDERLMTGAKGDAIFLHCLPAHRGDEVVDAVIDGPQSRVWDEAENRVHAQKSILLWALGKL